MRTSNGTARSRVVGLARDGLAPGFGQSSRIGETPDCRDDLDGESDLQLRMSWPEVRVGPVPLITCGVSEADLDGQVRAARSVVVRGLHIALRCLDPPHVVVLGDPALHRLCPSVIGPLLRRPGCAALAYARTCPAHRIADWARRCPMEFVPEGHELRSVAMAVRLVGQFVTDKEPSTVTARREMMREALAALQQARVFSVKLWADAIGKSRDWLDRLCAATLDCTPGEVVWAFFDARVRHEIRAGRSDEQIVVSVGVANEYVLRRAYSRRGLPFPRP